MPAPPLSQKFRPQPIRRAPEQRPARRIFICDDDLAFAQELAEGLTASGFEVCTLAESTSAIATFDGFAPDMALLDIYMPAPDGFEMLYHIWQSPLHRDIPLVLASGAASGLLEVAARFCIARKMRLAGAFQKPLKLADIVRICAIHTGTFDR